MNRVRYFIFIINNDCSQINPSIDPCPLLFMTGSDHQDDLDLVTYHFEIQRNTYDTSYPVYVSREPVDTMSPSKHMWLYYNVMTDQWQLSMTYMSVNVTAFANASAVKSPQHLPLTTNWTFMVAGSALNVNNISFVCQC